MDFTKLLIYNTDLLTHDILTQYLLENTIIIDDTNIELICKYSNFIVADFFINREKAKLLTEISDNNIISNGNELTDNIVGIFFYYACLYNNIDIIKNIINKYDYKIKFDKILPIIERHRYSDLFVYITNSLSNIEISKILHLAITHDYNTIIKYIQKHYQKIAYNYYIENLATIIEKGDNFILNFIVNNITIYNDIVSLFIIACNFENYYLILKLESKINYTIYHDNIIYISDKLIRLTNNVYNLLNHKHMDIIKWIYSLDICECYKYINH